LTTRKNAADNLANNAARVLTARALVLAGCVVLVVSAALHVVGGMKVGFPALAASNLSPELKSAFRVVFLSLGWHWVVTAAVVAAAVGAERRVRNTIILFCGAAVLVEAVVGASVMGLFVGNEMIGGAGFLLLCGGLLFAASTSR